MICTCMIDVLRSDCVPIGCTVTQGRSDMSVHIIGRCKFELYRMPVIADILEVHWTYCMFGAFFVLGKGLI